jgi:integrase
VRLRLDDGTWHRVSSKTADLDEASDRAKVFYYEAKVKAKNKLPQSTRKFASVAKAAVAAMEEELIHGRGKVVYSAYIGVIHNFLIPFFGKYAVDSITPAKLNDYEAWRRDRMGKAPAASTVTTHNAALVRIFDIALQHGWITRSTLPSLRNKGTKSETRPAFTFEEYRLLTRRMREWAKTGKSGRTRMMRELLRDYVLILANTGIRHGTEAMNLKWRHIEWFINRHGERFLQMTVDGKTGNRQLIARHNTGIYLRRIQSRFPEFADMSFDELLKARVDESVFRLTDGTRTEHLHQSFGQLLRDTDLLIGTASERPRTLYSLRHTYATLELYKGRNIHQLARQMGSSVAMLEKHYSKLTPMLMANEFAGERREAEDVSWG